MSSLYSSGQLAPTDSYRRLYYSSPDAKVPFRAYSTPMVLTGCLATGQTKKEMEVEIHTSGGRGESRKGKELVGSRMGEMRGESESQNEDWTVQAGAELGQWAPVSGFYCTLDPREALSGCKI